MDPSTGLNDPKQELIELLNQAHSSTDPTKKAQLLSFIYEFIFQRHLFLLPFAVPLVMEFQMDTHSTIQKTLLFFMEKAMLQNSDFMVQFFSLLRTLLSLDSASCSLSVLKKGCQIARRMFHPALRWILNPTGSSGALSSASSGGCWPTVESVIAAAEQLVLVPPMMTLLTSDQERDIWSKRFSYAVKFLEWVVLSTSEASDQMYRDPARSNVSPDELTLETIHELVGRSSSNAQNLLLPPASTFQQLGVRLMTSLVQLLFQSSKTEDDPRSKLAHLEFNFQCHVVLLQTLTLVSSLRPAFVPLIVTALLEYEQWSRPLLLLSADVDSRNNSMMMMVKSIRMTLRGNVLHLLRLPSVKKPHSTEILDRLQYLHNGTEQGLVAIRKAKEPRRKYVATPFQNVRGNRHSLLSRSSHLGSSGYAIPTAAAKTGKATSTSSKISSDTSFHLTIEKMAPNELTDFVMQSMEHLPSRPSSCSEISMSFQQMLHQLTSSSKELPLLTSEQAQNVFNHMQASQSTKRLLLQEKDIDGSNKKQRLNSSSSASSSSSSNAVTTTADDRSSSALTVTSDNAIEVQIQKPLSSSTCQQFARAAVLRILDERGNNNHPSSSSLASSSAHYHHRSSPLRQQILFKLLVAQKRWTGVARATHDNHNDREMILKKQDRGLPTLYRQSIDYICQHVQTRQALGISILYEEYMTKNNNDNSNYYRVFLEQLLQRLIPQLDTTTSADRLLFRKFIHECPSLSRVVFHSIKCELMHSTKGGIVLGITILRDIITNRPLSTYSAWISLYCLLYFAASVTESQRNPAIRCVANQLYSASTGGALNHFHDHIQHYALMKLCQLKGKTEEKVVDDSETSDQAAIMNADKKNVSQGHDDDPYALFHQLDQFSSSTTPTTVVDDEREELKTFVLEELIASESKSESLEKVNTMDTKKKEQGPREEQEDHHRQYILSHLELSLALCAKDSSLFPHLIELYSRCSSTTDKNDDTAIRTILFQSIEKLILHLKQKEGEVAVLEQCWNFTSLDAVPFIAHIVTLLATSASVAFVTRVYALYEESLGRFEHQINDRSFLKGSSSSQARPHENENAQQQHLNRHPIQLLLPALSGPLSRAQVSGCLKDLMLHVESVAQLDYAIAQLVKVVNPVHFLLDLHAIQFSPPSKNTERTNNASLMTDDDGESSTTIIADELAILLQQRTIHVLNLCLQRPLIFTSNVFHQVIQELIDTAIRQLPASGVVSTRPESTTIAQVLPRLTLRTMIVAVTHFPQLRKTILTSLGKLIKVKVWAPDDSIEGTPRETAVWTGFKKCISLLQPQSFQLLFQLPEDVLVEFTDTNAEVKELFRSYMSTREIYPALPERIKSMYSINEPLDEHEPVVAESTTTTVDDTHTSD